MSRLGDVWILGHHRLIQGDARETASYDCLMGEGELASLVLTDEPFNVANVGHVTGNPDHREFAMAHGEMSREEFAAFNRAWMAAAAARLVEGGLLSKFADQVNSMVQFLTLLDQRNPWTINLSAFRDHREQPF